MTDNHPNLNRVSKVSPIWIVPLIALLIAGWLALQAWRERGPEIQVVFDDAAGITVGRTQVRFRDVTVGEVIDIQLNDHFDKVTVFIELDPQVAPLMSEFTRFWVVAPRISLGGVSGLDTLLSGVYIEMDPGEKGNKRDKFDGLKEPPSIRSFDKGTQYIMLAEELGALDIGSPVYHRQVKVGRVTRYRLLPEAERVEIRIFIDAPYDKLIKTNTTFWNVSGFGVELGANGIVAKMETVTSLISGGLAFSTPPDVDAEHTLAKQGSQFYLFNDKEAVAEGALTFSYPYLLKFRSSVRGLVTGAPVEFRGIQVGKVEHVGLDAGIATDKEINVLISIQPERINPQEAPTLAELNQLFATLVSEGLRAELKTRSFLTGSLFVDLLTGDTTKLAGDIEPLSQYGEYLMLPTADGQYSQIAKRVADIAESIQQLPFDSIGKNLDKSLKSVAAIISDFNKAGIVEDIDQLLNGLNGSSDSLQTAIEGLQSTLTTIDQTVAPDSKLHYELTKMLDNVSGAAKSLEALTGELSRYPDALLRGHREDK